MQKDTIYMKYPNLFSGYKTTKIFQNADYWNFTQHALH